MTIRQAYLKAKSIAEREEASRLIECLDLGLSWAFSFLPQRYSSPTDVDGGGYTIVNKINGEITFTTYWTDFDLFDNAVKIPVEQFEPSPISFEERAPTGKLAYA